LNKGHIQMWKSIGVSNRIRRRYWLVISGLLILLVTSRSSFGQTDRLRLEPVFSALDDPVGIAHAGDGSGRLFIVERAGRVRIIEPGGILGAFFLDITDRVRSTSSEQGLLGLAFHPGFRGNGFFFVNYTDASGDTKVSRFTASTINPVDSGTEAVILSLAQPATNHNGGHLAFGPDGYLYIGTGDGGGGGDPFRNGQNGRTLLGAMLRIDVDTAFPYAIPADNPFVGTAEVLDEIWAIGLRNPWRYSFDRETGDLYIADVGQNNWEEVNLQTASSLGGENYGWPIMEGNHCFPIGSSCDRSGLSLPLHEYDHDQGCSVTGGYVYRGRQNQSMIGAYIYGDFCSGRIWGSTPGDGNSRTTEELGQFNILISSFGEDESGELYVLDKSGSLYRLHFPSTAPAPPTGLRLARP
jgi:hypothetical protein